MKRRKTTKKRMKSYRITYPTKAEQENRVDDREQVRMNQMIEDKIDIDGLDLDELTIQEIDIEDLKVDGLELFDDLFDEETERQVQQKKEDLKNKRRKEGKKRRAKRRAKLSIVATLIVVLLAGVYYAGSFYFDNHFYYNTRIGGLPCGGMTVEAVEKKLVEKDEFLITVVTKDKEYTVDFGKMKATYAINHNIEDILNKQKKTNWIIGCVEETEVEAMATLSYEEEELKKYIEQLDFLQEKNIIKPVDAKIIKSETGYEVVEEIEGNQVDKNKLYQLIIKAIKEKRSKVDLVKEDCYIKPRITKSSSEIMQLQKQLTKAQNTSVTYQFGEQREVLDGTQIWSWITMSDNYTITFNKDKISEYVKNLAKKYDTIGKSRIFLSTEGREVKVGGGSYGWKIDQKKEIEGLMEAIQKGGSQKREPIYAQKAFSRNKNDIGTTYIEIDLTNQKMYYYEKGVQRISTDIVSGNMIRGNATPEGTFMVIQKARNRTLRGVGYESFVNYWIRVDGGIGIHDASWRSKYGGTIYKTKGSHGCINTPYVKVRELYSLVKMYTPIVCFY